MLYIHFAIEVSTESEEVAPGIVPDFAERGHVIGIEIKDASKFVDLSRLEVSALPIANLILSKRMLNRLQSAFVSSQNHSVKHELRLS